MSYSFMSQDMPRLGKQDIGTVHLGHGHWPMLCIEASNTLKRSYQVKTIGPESKTIYAGTDSLFGIVSGIGEYLKIKPVIDTITTMNDNPMFPCLYKFIVKKDSPLCMEHLTMAMSHEVGRWCFTTKMVSCEIFEAVMELESVREPHLMKTQEYIHD